MITGRSKHRRWIACTALILLASFGPDDPRLRGWLTQVWTEDPRPGHELRYFFHGSDGVSREVTLDRNILAALGPTAIGQGVEVEATLRGPRLTEVVPLPVPSAAARARPVGPLPYAWLLCRYGDDPSTPFLPPTLDHLLGNSYPGIGHFYGDLSRGVADFAGSAVYGWYTLPQPKAYYIGVDGGPRFSQIADECVAAAGSDLHLPDFAGVVLQLNGTLAGPGFPGRAYGGRWIVTQDGGSGVYGTVWLPGSAATQYRVLFHELGHSLGWSHSGGAGNTERDQYNSRWDVMSGGSFTDPAYGEVGVYTIAYNKYRAGWIPEERIWRPVTGAPVSFLLHHSSRHLSGPGYELALLPYQLPNSTGWYTVEAREMGIGYDRVLPGNGVVIHRVDAIIPRGVVMDGDRNDDPSDAGATWTPGELFTDPTNGVYITIDSIASAGSWITIKPPPVIAPLLPTQQILTSTGLSAEERRFLDVLGNRNGGYDIGDLISHLDRNGLPLTNGGTR